jgi:cytochrome c553
MKLFRISALPALYLGAALMTSFAQTFASQVVGDAKAGQEKSSDCVACHSVDGNSSDPANPKIAGQHERYVARHLQLFKTGERENAVMLGFASLLSEQDMADLGAYFATTKVNPGVADEAYVAQGQALYRGGRNGLPSCMGCHGPSGRGNPAAGYPALAGQHSAYTKSMLERFRAGTAFGEKDKAHNLIMSQVAVSLSDAEIAALSSYIEGLHAQ